MSIPSAGHQAMLSSRLPYKRRVEYLESTGTQYIDTGIYPSNDIGTLMDVLFVSTYGNTYYCIFEARRAYHNADFGIINFVDSNNQFQFRYGNRDNISSKLATDNVYEIRTENRFLSINGETRITVGANSFSTPVTLKLFAADNNGTITPQAGIRLYYFKIFDGATLVRSLIPVIDFNDVACMYDEVTGAFFYNKGTGSFIVPT